MSEMVPALHFFTEIARAQKYQAHNPRHIPKTVQKSPFQPRHPSTYSCAAAAASTSPAAASTASPFTTATAAPTPSTTSPPSSAAGTASVGGGPEGGSGGGRGPGTLGSAACISAYRCASYCASLAATTAPRVAESGSSCGPSPREVKGRWQAPYCSAGTTASCVGRASRCLGSQTAAVIYFQ